MMATNSVNTGLFYLFMFGNFFKRFSPAELLQSKKPKMIQTLKLTRVLKKFGVSELSSLEVFGL